MDKKTVLEALKKAKEDKKRKFSQSYDLIFNLKELDLKKPDQQVDFFATLPNAPKKKVKVCALVGSEMAEEARGAVDGVITQEEFQRYGKDKKAARKLAQQYDYFIAQANFMAQVASAFGRVFGPRGKMPNPKAGCVIAPKTPMKPLYEKLQKMVKVSAKKEPIIQCVVGHEGMTDDEVAENVMAIYDQLIHHLPNEKNNVKSAYFKMTMSKPVRLE